MRVARGGGTHPAGRWWAAGAVVLIALGLVLLILGARGRDVGPQLPGPIGHTGASTSSVHAQSLAAPVAAAQLATWPVVAGPGRVSLVNDVAHVRTTRKPSPPAPAFLARSRPEHLWIPKLHVSTSIVVLGLNPDGSVQVPSNTVQVGWYKYGPTPGQRGSSVILGHVDSYRGIGVFFYLDTLRPGDQVLVRLADHQIARFSVIGLREYTKAQFPERIVYGSRTYSALQLVTCGGVFDHQTGHYLSNIVVYTKRIVPRR